MATDEEIEKRYFDAQDRGELGADGELFVGGKRDLVIVQKSFLEVERYLREQLEREIDELKTAQSVQWFESHGYLDNLIGPEHEVAEAPVRDAVMKHSDGTVVEVLIKSLEPVERATIHKASSEYVAVRKPSSDFTQSSPARSKITAPAGALRHRRKVFGSGV